MTRVQDAGPLAIASLDPASAITPAVGGRHRRWRMYTEAMGKDRSKRRSKRRSPPPRRSGVMQGMRSGFKNVAGTVTGDSADKASGSPWWGWIIALIMAAAVISFLSDGL